jgi:cephalosporin hydroxylase
MSTQIQGWFDFANIYERAVAGAKQGDILIELGVWKGASLCCLAKLARDANKGLTVIGIDNWKHNDWDGYAAISRLDRENAGDFRTVREQCEDNLRMRGLLDFVTLIESDTIEAAAKFDGESVRFIFIDDTHNSEHINAEICAWLPKIIPGAWIGGHDFPGNIEDGVMAILPHAVQDGTSWVAYV